MTGALSRPHEVVPVTAAVPEVLLADAYEDDLPLGHVLGTRSTSGAVRGGVDVEGRLAVDNGALRMRPLARPGWGREGVAYGPLPRQPGLTMSVQVLNGHHASQTFYLPESRRQVARRWAGSLTRGRWPGRPRHHENLAVGVFGSAAPADPLEDGHGLVVHADTAENGELWAAVCGRPLRVLTGLQNLPLAVTVVLREQGAVYYAATAPDDPDLPALPAVRPLAVDPFGGPELVHPGVHQRILGEVGYRIDTRVYRTDVALCPDLARWCTSAVIADRLIGDGPLHGTVGECGGPWSVRGAVRRTPDGVTGGGRLLASAPEPVGLLHALVRADAGGAVELVLRADEAGLGWRVRVDADGAVLVRESGAGAEELARGHGPALRRGQVHSLQVLDDGCRVSAHLDGRLLVEVTADRRDAELTGVGAAVDGPAWVRDLEAHPRAVPAPLMPDNAWRATPKGTTVCLDERFDGEPGPLDGVRTPSGQRTWERVEGAGALDLLPGGGARVRATPDAPNPGRTLYAVPWDAPDDVDVRLTLLPPGSARGERHNCRAGLVLWQDEENYLVVNVWLDDWLHSTSVSTFYRVRGHEDMHDAVWTLTGDRVTWGVPFELRVAFDGERFTAYVDGRPTLYRAIRDVYPDAPRLAVRRIALIANEEWGDDTGSTFLRLVALTSQEASP